MMSRSAAKSARLIELIELVKSGDKQAQEMLLSENVALVHSVAKRFRNRGADYDDIFQTGCVGFIKAVQRFDTSYGVQFSTYAVPMIMGEIRRFLRDDGLLRVSRSIKENARKLIKLQEDMKMDLGREPTLTELSKHSNHSVEDIAFLLEAFVHPASLDAPVSETNEAETALIEAIPNNNDQESEAIRRLMLKNALSGLDNRERKIIYLRYFKDRTQSETAKEIGVSQVQVSRLESKILLKMRKIIS